jgi:hypothetical protein
LSRPRGLLGSNTYNPGVSSPAQSGPLLASVALDERWAHLRDGAFVVKDELREVKASASDPARES